MSSPEADARHLRLALQQALADKEVLVQALQALSRALAVSRAESRQHAEAYQRAVACAARLGRIGQLGLSMAETQS
jgi:hypothetical protein